MRHFGYIFLISLLKMSSKWMDVKQEQPVISTKLADTGACLKRLFTLNKLIPCKNITCIRFGLKLSRMHRSVNDNQLD